jgi:anti-anti-sigma factor
MTEPTAEVEAETLEDHVVVRLTGEIDVFNAATITNEIEDSVPTEAHGAVIDLTGVGFLDSTAIRKLFGLATRLTERRQRMLIVASGGSTVQRTLQLVEFSRAAPMHTTLEDALRSLGIAGAGS